MSAKIVKQEIQRFLDTPHPEILSISGRWGVGKTYSWKKYLSEYSDNGNGIPLPRYSYVSLFGLNTLDQLKFAIFENTRTKADATSISSPSTFRKFFRDVENMGRAASRYATSIPKINTLVQDISPTFFLSVRNQIICFDDLERHGSQLELKQILGMISFLKEERNCKVVILMNEDGIDDTEKEEFDRYFEKVFERPVRFDPTTEECLNICIETESNVNTIIREKCNLLKISNIRTLNKIIQKSHDLEGIVKDLHPDVLTQGVTAVCLFTWARLHPDQAPSLEFLRRDRQQAMIDLMERKEDRTDGEASWNAFLEQYGFWHSDEFDIEIDKGLSQGVFDRDALREHALHLHDISERSKRAKSFQYAWETFRSSFKDNEDDVVEEIRTKFYESLDQISPAQLHAVVKVFKQLERSDEAKQFIQDFVNRRKDNPEIFDLERSSMFERFDDPDMIRVFEEKRKSHEKRPSLEEVLDNLGDSWSRQEIQVLSESTVQDYFEVLRNKDGQSLERALSGIWQFQHISNRDEEMDQALETFKSALREIGKTSRINRLRVSRFGINVDE